MNTGWDKIVNSSLKSTRWPLACLSRRPMLKTADEFGPTASEVSISIHHSFFVIICYFGTIFISPEWRCLRSRPLSLLKSLPSSLHFHSYALNFNWSLPPTPGLEETVPILAFQSQPFPPVSRAFAKKKIENSKTRLLNISLGGNFYFIYLRVCIRQNAFLQKYIAICTTWPTFLMLSLCNS